jgi:hypothetical protein
MICAPHQMLFGDEIKKNRRGEGCDTCVGEGNCIHGLGGE